MAIALAMNVLSASGGEMTPSISAQLSRYGVDAWPVHEAAVSISPYGTGHMGWPVASAAGLVGGGLAHGYVQDYYDRVHVLPAVLDVGNLASEQVRTLDVWNAWRTATLTLRDVEAQNVDGIAIDAPSALPILFAPLQLRSWTVSVYPDGPATIDARLRFAFDDGEIPQAAIVGVRLIAWMIPPDWSDGITETLAWLTDVQTADDGTQTRLICRDTPRRQWEFAVLAEDGGRQILEAALYAWTARTWALPVWTDVIWQRALIPEGASTIAADMTGRDYVVGGLAAIWASPSEYEVVEISQVTAQGLVLKHPTQRQWPVGSRIYPCRSAWLTDAPALARQSSAIVAGHVRFQADDPCAWPPILPAPTYLGYPVLEDRTNEPGDLPAAYPRQISLIDNDAGRPLVVDRTQLPWMTQRQDWLVHGLPRRQAHRSLLYALQGRAQAVWLPTWTDDLTLTTDIVATDTSLTVRWLGYTRFLRGGPGRRHLRVEMVDGTVYYRRIIAWSEAADGTEQLAINAAFGVAIARRRIRQVSWMMLATLNSDTVEIKHIHDIEGSAQASSTFVAVPREEP